MKKLLPAAVLAIFFVACNSGNQQNGSAATGDTAATDQSATTAETANPSYDPKRGEGKFHNVEVGPFDAALAEKGKSIYNTKCQSCHKLTDEKLVGPGWKGVTKKHTVDWILNFITNPDPMLDKDPELKNQLEICMVRMPNQNLTDDDAKAVYEFMRENDGAK